MKRLIGIIAVAVAITGVSLTSDAKASHWSHRHSHHNYSYPSSGFSFQSGGFGLSYGNYGNYGNYGYGSCYQSAPVWHNTSHYDYHPTQVIPHGNHYDVIPGHYDFHRTGHWDY